MSKELTRQERVFLDHIEYFRSTILDAKTKPHGMYSHTINQRLSHLINHMERYVDYNPETKKFGLIDKQTNTIKWYPLRKDKMTYEDMIWFKLMSNSSMEIQSKFYMLEKIKAKREGM